MCVRGHVYVCSVCRFCLFLRFFYMILELFRLFYFRTVQTILFQNCSDYFILELFRLLCFSFYYLRINLIRKCENSYIINICIGIIKLIKSAFIHFVLIFFCILFQIYNLPDPMKYFICCTLTKAACVFIVKVIKERRNPTIVLVVFQTLRFEKVREKSTGKMKCFITSCTRKKK